jgi:uncharacterized OsmC-like protein
MSASTSSDASSAAGEVVAIQAGATATFGRFLIGARQQHFVSDTKEAAGGPGDAIRAGELLLSALASCGLGLVQKAAHERGLALSAAKVDASFTRDPEDATRYAAIHLQFVLGGVDLDTARALVAAFTDACPIYNTLRRGGPIEAGVSIV